MKLGLGWKWDWMNSGFEIKSVDIRAGPLTVFTDKVFQNIVDMINYVEEVYATDSANSAPANDTRPPDSQVLEFLSGVPFYLLLFLFSLLFWRFP